MSKVRKAWKCKDCMENIAGESHRIPDTNSSLLAKEQSMPLSLIE